MKLHSLLLLNLVICTGVALFSVGVHCTESSSPPFACDSANPLTQSFPFCNTTLPISQRVSDLVPRLTLDEKISQLISTAPAIPRLGIPAYEWWSESLHGIRDRHGIRFNGTIRSATSFPQVILTAASFDAQLWYRIAQAIGVETRAMFNAGQAMGMTFWAPNINIFRDPRWGRGQETAGEDPFVNAKYSVSYVRGLQGEPLEGGKIDILQASACCKHFTAYDLDNWQGVDRYKFDARVTMQDLADTYQPPFQRCIEEGRASGLMCAYNMINGVPNCADSNLLTKTARGQWGFDGYIASDCDAVSLVFDEQGYANSSEEAVADVIKAGMDVDCGKYILKHGKSAVDQKLLAESDIDKALHNLFAVRMRLGLFNGDPKKLQFGDIGPDQACSKEHQALALDAARSGIVLLKNSDKLLPLSKGGISSIAVIGPNANATDTLLGNYAGPPCKFISPLQGLQNYVNNTEFHPGCDDVACSSASIEMAVDIAKVTDYVVLFMGLDQTQEREKHDRTELGLPGKQEELITSVAKAAKKPVILVLLSGGPVDISFAKASSYIGSILWAGYPGEAGGAAIAETIFGDNNPGGRLPSTWYTKDFTKIPMTDMRMRPDPASGYPGRTYRFYTGEKVFEFGDGLSYSNYSYEFQSVTQNKLDINQPSTTGPRLVSELGTEFCEARKFSATVGVKNEGDVGGKHPVLLFVKPANASDDGRPIKQLVGFQSVNLDAGKSTSVKFMLSPCEHLSSANKDGSMIIETGSHLLVAGDKEYPITVA